MICVWPFVGFSDPQWIICLLTGQLDSEKKQHKETQESLDETKSMINNTKRKPELYHIQKAIAQISQCIWAVSKHKMSHDEHHRVLSKFAKTSSRMRRVSFGPMLSIDTFYNIQWFWLWTAKAQISLRICAVWSGPLLSTLTRRYIFAWHSWYEWSILISIFLFPPTKTLIEYTL